MSRYRTRIPNLFIVGQPKSGTTALHHFLNEHPDIFMSNYKEPSYFCHDFHEESDAYHGKKTYFPIRDRDQYLELFGGATNEKIVGESSVNYLYSNSAAHEIRKFNPEARIIMILRDPVDFLYSLFQMNVRRTWETGANFREAMELELKRQHGECLPTNVNFPSTLLYARRACYHDQVQRFIECFGRNQIKVLIYEDFKKDNAGCYAGVLEFLGVNTMFRPEFRVVNPSGSVRFNVLNRLLRQRWIIRLGYMTIPKSMHVRIQQNVLNKLFSKAGPPPLNNEFRLSMRKQLLPEVEKISRLLDRDLVATWNYPG